MLEFVPLPNSSDGLLRCISAPTSKRIISTWPAAITCSTRNHHLSGRYFYDQFEIPTIIDPKNMLTAVAPRRWSEPKRCSQLYLDASPSLLSSSSLSYNRASNIAHAPDFPGHHAFGINVPSLSTGDTFRIGVNELFQQLILRSVSNSAQSIQSSARLDLYLRPP